MVGLCYGFNYLFAYSAKTKPNYESAAITGLIVTMIVGPVAKFDLENFLFLGLVSLLAMGSKYVFVAHKRHIFNPAAFGVLAAFLIIGKGASWWVGSQYLLPIILLGGFLLLQKIRRWHLIVSFLCAYLPLTIFVASYQGPTEIGSIMAILKNVLLSSPIIFFSFVMLPEPLTGPQDRTLRIYYGSAIGLCLVGVQTFLTIPYSLELSLLAGNIVARLVNPGSRISLHLRRKEKIDTNIYNFWFEPEHAVVYAPGQFLEYTLPHAKSDSRGVRRFFTIASSPVEKNILISTRIQDEKASSFKKALLALEPGDEIVASNLEGNFVLPENIQKKLAFIAGGIGITPFRSMAKHIVANKLYRDIILLYSNRRKEDVVFEEIFDNAKEYGFKAIYVNTESEGYIKAERIKSEIPDALDRHFYVSGPEPMVEAFEDMLYQIGLPKKQVKRDYFPGYAESHQA